MTNTDVKCLPTKWFLSRAILMTLLFLGFGGYFFYDASIGYPQKNKTFCIHKTFVEAGKVFDPSKYTSESWKKYVSEQSIDFANLPIPEGTDRNKTPWPSELGNHRALNSEGWNGLWTKYSELHQLPYKAPEQGFDNGKIKEQWIAGSICLLISCYCIFLLLRTMARRMTIEGANITAAGKTFTVQDISLIDMRKWKNKGLARATVCINGKETNVRLDGLTYGGFEEKLQPNTAENFIQSLLSIYKGEILDYEENIDEGES